MHRKDPRYNRAQRPQNPNGNYFLILPKCLILDIVQSKYKSDKSNRIYNTSLPQPALKITTEMKKLRGVSPRFFKNKRKLLSKFRSFGIGDERNWTLSKGEGITYEKLLKMPFYEDGDTIPENSTRKNNLTFYQELPKNWDDYFEAIQQNFKGGFTSRLKTTKKGNESSTNTERQQFDQFSNMYNDTQIEWDEIQQPDSTSATNSKKYKMKFKQISENEKNEIMKKIDIEEGISPTVNLVTELKTAAEVQQPKSHQSQKVFSVEEIEGNLTSAAQKMTVEEIKSENDDFFNDEGDLDNQFAVCKENFESTDQTIAEDVTAFTDVDVEELKKNNNDVELATVKLEKPISEDKENQKTVDQKEISETSPKIVTVEEIEQAQLSSIQPQSQTQHIKNIQESNQPQNIVQAEPISPQPQQPSPSYSNISYSTQMPVSHQQMMHQHNELQSQQMIEQLNQEEMKKAMLQNPNLMYQYQQEAMNSYSPANSIPDDVNPFEGILRENPTSQWYYKDPQGFVRGPFTCFDMYTWHTEGYFSEDLELSLDCQSFFRLNDLRAFTQRSSSHHEVPQNMSNQYMNQGYYKNMPGASYGSMSPGMQSPYNPMYSPYGQNTPYQTTSGAGYQNPTAYSQNAHEGASYSMDGNYYPQHLPSNYYSQ